MEHHFQMLFAVGIKELVLWPMTVVSIFFSPGDRITGLIGVTMGSPTRELCFLLAPSLLPFSYHTGISHHLTFKINSPFIWVTDPAHSKPGEEPWDSCLNLSWGPLPLHQTQWSSERPLPTPQWPWLLRSTLRSFLRSLAQVDGTQGFLLQPKKDLESPSLTRFQAQFPYHDSRTMTGSLSPRA